MVLSEGARSEVTAQGFALLSSLVWLMFGPVVAIQVEIVMRDNCLRWERRDGMLEPVRTEGKRDALVAGANRREAQMAKA